MRRWLLALGVVAVVVAASPASAGAGGTTLRFDRAEYQPGDAARATGRVGAVAGSGWVDDGPYFVSLLETSRWLALEATAAPWPAAPPGARRVGEVRVAPGADTASRVITLDFVVPDVPVGHYSLIVCNDPCTRTIGDLVGGNVGVNAPGAPPLPPIIGIPPAAAEDVTPPTSTPAIAADNPVLPPADDERTTSAWLWIGIGAVVLAAIVATARRGRGPSARARSAPQGS